MSDASRSAAVVEIARQQALHRYRVVDTPPDRVLASIAGVAARAFDAPMGVVSVTDDNTVWLIGAHGMGDDTRSTPRHEGLCEPVISGQADFVIIGDARDDPRTADNQFVREHSIVSYVCVPITTFDGHRIGAVAVMDTESKTSLPTRLALLEDLATIVMEQLELRLSSLDALRIERRERYSAESARDDARNDLDTAQHDRDRARLARDTARADLEDANADRDAARAARDSALEIRRAAVRDRDIAEHDRDVVEEFATVLQQTLLPPSLPTIDGLATAAYYHPADPRRVGGDFYDLFVLADHRCAFFIGDVQGHGPDAAVATSLIRYTLRSLALHYPDPADVLRELNAVLLREVEPRRFCTVMLGTLEPNTARDGVATTIATGGHPPALLIDPDAKTVTPVRSSTGMLIGATPNAVFGSCAVDLRRGQTILLYTDGLIEARKGSSPFDEAALAAYVQERCQFQAAPLVDELTTLIAKLDPRDDIAVLALTAT